MQKRSKTFKKISNTFRQLKEKFKSISTATLISIFAIVISSISFYFQFLNKNHNILYTSLVPTFDNSKATLEVPIFFKNTGNQSELILGVALLLEDRDSIDSVHYERINLNDSINFPILLNLNENRIVKLKSNYYEYLLSTLILDQHGTPLRFKNFKAQDNLILKATVQFITKFGYLSEDTLDVGNISFDKNGEIQQLSYNAIKLRNLDLSNDLVIGNGTHTSILIQDSLNLGDPKNVKKNSVYWKYNINKLKDSVERIRR